MPGVRFVHSRVRYQWTGCYDPAHLGQRYCFINTRDLKYLPNIPALFELIKMCCKREKHQLHRYRE